MKTGVIRRWLRRFVLALLVAIPLILFVVFPIAASFLITNARFNFPERGPKTADDVGLAIEGMSTTTTDDVTLRGWWNPGDPTKPLIIFVHGLNRSRIELLERAAESNVHGYGVLLFDLRNHGQSGRASTTLGIHESMDVCAASEFAKQQAPNRPRILWGVSMGASSALLAAKRCPGFLAVVSDSAFLSFSETIAHHLKLYFHLPEFPIANLIVGLTSRRASFNVDDGDVENAVRGLHIPILFIAGGADRRMPPETAKRLLDAAPHPRKHLLVVPNAKHGEAFSTDRTLYMDTVFKFIDQSLAKEP